MGVFGNSQPIHGPTELEFVELHRFSLELLSFQFNNIELGIFSSDQLKIIQCLEHNNHFQEGDFFPSSASPIDPHFPGEWKSDVGMFQPFDLEGGGWKTNSTAEEILLRGYDVQVPEILKNLRFWDVLRKWYDMVLYHVCSKNGLGFRWGHSL